MGGMVDASSSAAKNYRITKTMTDVYLNPLSYGRYNASGSRYGVMRTDHVLRRLCYTVTSDALSPKLQR